MKQYVISNNEYLKQYILGYFNTEYLRYGNPGNPDYLNILKNTYNSYDNKFLIDAYNNVKNVVLKDILEIFIILGQPKKFKICVVPRSKADFKETQLYFKKAISDVVEEIEKKLDKKNCIGTTINGTNYIKRHTNTYTTHLGEKAPNYINDGDKPYPGITNNTCHISDEISGNHILLIDDIYTKNVNIDEDVIQALIEKGATGVTFYSVAKTV